MIHPRNITRFGGACSLHAVTMASPRRRTRPSLSTVHLTASEAAIVLAFLDGLNLVCAASSVGGGTNETGAKAGMGAQRRADDPGLDPLPVSE